MSIRRNIKHCLLMLGLLVSPSIFAGYLSFPNTPLTATSEPPPNVVLALSVEFPTAGLAYNNNAGALISGEDQGYVPTRTYIGYFDSNKCYRYNAATTSGNTGYFEPAGKVIDTVNYYCNTLSSAPSASLWSGNYLNWVVTSAIDILRKNLTGGYRLDPAMPGSRGVNGDLPNLTILSRARLQGNETNNFPKRRTGVGTGINTTGGRVAVDARLITQFTNVNTRQVRIVNSAEVITVQELDASGNSLVTDRIHNPWVQVCVPNVPGFSPGAGIEANCTRYGSNYKPEGNIQKYAASMRFSAFGYLMDNTRMRNGGVLRAPMKMTGPQTWVSGAYIANANVEWNTSTGVFLVNPDSAAEGNSGVINYLNKFGLTSNYKTYDNISEMYSEAVRYLMAQGRQPFPSSISGITTAMKDGFPVYTTWSDPLLGYCQKNNIILIGDTNTHCDGSVPGGGELSAANCGTTASTPDIFNATNLTNQIGSLESRPGLATSNTGATNGTFLGAGIAWYANTNDLRPDLSSGSPARRVTARTFVIDVGEPSGTAFHQRQFWYMAKYGGFIDTNANGQPDTGEWEVTVPAFNVGSNTYTNIPRTLFFAGSPQRLMQGLDEIFQTIASSVGGTGTTATSSNRITSGTGVYSIVTDSDTWTGDLLKYNISVVRSGASTSLSVSSSPSWSAADKLTGRTSPVLVPPAIAPADRNIWTTLSDGSVSPFTSSNTEILTYFNLTDLLGVQRINWLRGDRTLEGSLLGIRSSLLSDAGRSGALYVGPPSQAIPDPTYSSYARANANRPGLIFVGASSGFLHAFRDSDGVEAFAFLPRALWHRAREFTERGAGRKPGLDAVPSTADVQLSSSTDWRTVVVGGFGAGARGIYLIDATVANNVRPLWEFTPSSPGIDPQDANDLGHVTGSVRIAKMPTGDWVAIFGNGYNSTNNRSALFIVKLNNPSGVWSRNVNYWKYAANTVPSTPASAPANGLGPAGVASLESLGVVEYIYAGDLSGRMYRWDFSNVVSSLPSSTEVPASSRPFILINVDRPITTAPKLAFHPNGGLQVLFGTGKLLEEVDRAAPFTQQFVYGIWDKNRSTSVANSITGSPPPIAQRTLITSGSTRTISGAGIDYTAGQAGWRIALTPTGAERVIADPDLEFGKFSFITVSAGSGVCAEGGSWLYNIDPITGLTPPRSFDTNGDGRIDDSDAVVAGVALGSSSYGSPTNLRIPSLGLTLGEVNYFTLLPDGSRPPGGAGFKSVLNKAVGPSGRINFKQITR